MKHGVIMNFTQNVPHLLLAAFQLDPKYQKRSGLGSVESGVEFKIIFSLVEVIARSNSIDYFLMRIVSGPI